MSDLDLPKFRAALGNLAATQAALADASKNDSEGWRHAVIAQRRQLQACIGALSDLVTTAERASGDAAEGRALRDAFNRMRSETALHQTKWPAVTIDRADPGYLASLQDVRAANRAFAGLAERVFGPRWRGEG